MLDVNVDDAIEFHRTKLGDSTAPIALQRNHQQAHGIQEKSRKRSALVFLVLSAVFLTGIWYWQNPEDNPLKKWVENQANRQPVRTEPEAVDPVTSGSGESRAVESPTTVDSGESGQEIAISLPEPNFAEEFENGTGSAPGGVGETSAPAVEPAGTGSGDSVVAGETGIGEPLTLTTVTQSGTGEGAELESAVDISVATIDAAGEADTAVGETVTGDSSVPNVVPAQQTQRPDQETQSAAEETPESAVTETVAVPEDVAGLVQPGSEAGSDQQPSAPEIASLPTVGEQATGTGQSATQAVTGDQGQENSVIGAGDTVPGAEVVSEDALTEITEDTELFLASSESALPPGMEAGPENKLRVTIENQTWLDIRDVTGAKLIYRTVEGGELIDLAGQPPFYVFIGAIEGVSIEYLGRPVTFEPDSSGVFARFRVGEVPQ